MSVSTSYAMEIDAELMFECLMYLNVYYYSVFATCNTIITIAKERGGIYTPKIGQDASVTFTFLFSEALKILLFNRYKERRRALITVVTLLLTMVTITGQLYTFFIQKPVVKLEYILSTLMMMLAVSEVVFGVLQLLPCCKKVQYY